MGEFLLGCFISACCGFALVILTDVTRGTDAQTKEHQALITQCEPKLTRDRVCVLQAAPELEISK